MTEYALDPAFVRLDYSTAYGAHVMLIPTLAWLPTPITGNMGSYIAWDSTPRDAEDMIDTFVGIAKAFLDPTSSFNLATIYTKASPTAPNTLAAIKSLAVVGTSAAGGVRKAVQATFNFKTAGGQAMKLVFLDYPHGAGQFEKQPFLSWSADALALFGELNSVASAWAGRDKTRIVAGISVTNTLNEKLRKQYHMG